MFDNEYINLALEEANKAFQLGEVPVGAVIVDSLQKKVITAKYNLCETAKNPLAHAEILAINEACLLLDTKHLTNCDLYVTLEPCSLCAAAISFARLRRLYYAASDPKFGAVESNYSFYNSPNCFHKPEIYSGIGKEKSVNMLKKFFVNLR